MTYSFANSECFMNYSLSPTTVLGGVVLFQVIYAFTHQPSLVPLLSVTAACGSRRHGKPSKALPWLRWVAGAVLWLWVCSLLVLPLFSWGLNPIFTSGDLTLFWYIMIAPSTYTSVSFIITATFTSFAAMVGSFMIIRIARSQRPKQAVDAIP